MDDKYTIRTATNADLDIIKVWIKDFRCNLNIIKRYTPSGEVAVIEVNGEIVGFLLHSCRELSILEIHHNYRRKGYGKALAQWAEKYYFDQNINILEVECTPENSVTFWKNMGFTIFEKKDGRERKKHGQKVLERNFNLVDGEKIPVLIEFYPESVLYEQRVQPFKIYNMEKCLTSGGVIDLPKRAICSYIELQGDPVISIHVNGQNIYKDKTKRECAYEIGVIQGKDCTYYIDQIILPI